MTDMITTAQRSELMRRIRSLDTKPELAVRSIVHALGYRYRLHVKDLPGHPDIVFTKRRKIIFVHGCFWHMHPFCQSGRVPKSRQAYWEPKLQRTRERDVEHMKALAQLGWQVLVVWECELPDLATLQSKISEFLT